MPKSFDTMHKMCVEIYYPISFFEINFLRNIEHIQIYKHLLHVSNHIPKLISKLKCYITFNKSYEINFQQISDASNLSMSILLV